ATDQMVVVRGRAPAVGSLAVLEAQHVDLPGLGQALQVAVDRGQADLLTGVDELRVDLLGAAEVVVAVEDPGYGQPLLGRACPDQISGAGAVGLVGLSVSHSALHSARVGGRSVRSPRGRRTGWPGGLSSPRVRGGARRSREG